MYSCNLHRNITDLQLKVIYPEFTYLRRSAGRRRLQTAVAAVHRGRAQRSGRHYWWTPWRQNHVVVVHLRRTQFQILSLKRCLLQFQLAHRRHQLELLCFQRGARKHFLSFEYALVLNQTEGGLVANRRLACRLRKRRSSTFTNICVHRLI